MISSQVSYFVLYVRWPCLVGLAAEINKTVKLTKLVKVTIRLSSVHVYLLISSIGLRYFHCKKGEPFTTVTYLSVLSTRNTVSQISIRLGLLVSFEH